MGEFELIRQFFTRPAERAVLGVGDDCALLALAPGTHMAISSDMLVSGRHFFPDADPRKLGHKCLAVNLSDLAACGARPVAFTLALALPEANPDWLQPFSQGLWALADAHGCELIGGDTTKGPLTICITVFGEVPVVDGKSQALLRSGAQVGDDLYVSGTLGDARLALEAIRGNIHLSPEALATARVRMDTPTPRVGLGMSLRGIASAAADISDGLSGDLGHILERSSVGANIVVPNAMHLLAASQDSTLATGTFSPEISTAMRMQCILAGGDDYELVFTAAPERRTAVEQAALASQTPVTRIGCIVAREGLHLLDSEGNLLPHTLAGFDHFSE